jgi:hypothetical protein
MADNDFLNIAFERARLSGAALNGYDPKKSSVKLLKKDLELLDKLGSLYIVHQMVIAANRYLIIQAIDSSVTNRAIKHNRKKFVKKVGS